MNQWRALNALQTLRQAELDQVLADLAAALTTVDEQSLRLESVRMQRLAIVQAHGRQTGDGGLLTPKALELLGRQYQAADAMHESRESAHAQACERRDELKGEVALLRGRVDALERNQEATRRELSRERDRVLANQLDDLWLGRLAFSGRLA